MLILSLIVAWCAVSSLLALAAAAFFKVGLVLEPSCAGHATTEDGEGRDADFNVPTLA